MKTLTITDAKRNLGKWLKAAAQGEEIGIISGADVIALRKVEVEASDYAWKEYGVTQQELERYIENELAETKQELASGKSKRFTEKNILAEIEKISRH